MAKAKQLASGKWRVQVSTGEKKENGKYRYESITAATEKEANYAAMQYELGYKKLNKDKANMTLNEAIQSYIDSKDGILSPSTIKGYDVIKRNNLKSLMQIKLNKLTQTTIQTAINNESKLSSPKRVRNIYGLLSVVLKQYRPDFQIRISLPQKRRTTINILNMEQTATLLEAIKGKSIEVPVLLAVWLGMRKSEILGLTWKCVDYDKSTITIKAAKVLDINNNEVLKTTKTYSSNRVLQVPDYIMEKIKGLPQKNEFVISIKGVSVYEGFKDTLKKNNLPDIRFHDLRHINASIMLILNIPDKYAMDRGGWATNHTMKNVYQHTLSEERKTIDNMINNYFERLLSHELSHEK